MSRQDREARQAAVGDWATRSSGESDSRYSSWFADLNEIIFQRTGGLRLADLPDYQFRDAFDSGMTPPETADEIIERGIL
jgi:hypothetical protein